VIPLEATKEYAQGRFGVWPEDADADGVLRETARALDNVVSVWCDVRTAYRRTMLDLTQTPFGRQGRRRSTSTRRRRKRSPNSIRRKVP